MFVVFVHFLYPLKCPLIYLSTLYLPSLTQYKFSFLRAFLENPLLWLLYTITFAILDYCELFFYFKYFSVPKSLYVDVWHTYLGCMFLGHSRIMYNAKLCPNTFTTSIIGVLNLSRLYVRHMKSLRHLDL